MASSTSSFVSFSLAAESATCARGLLCDLLSSKQSSSRACARLLRILEQENKMLRVKVYEEDRYSVKKYSVFMISCSVDRLLIKLAKSDYFPRGFALVHDKVTGRLTMHGGPPKFDNDDVNEVIVVDGRTDKDQTVDAMTLSKKYSGFFVLVIPLSETSWTLCTKNTCDHGSVNYPSTAAMVADARKIVSEYMTPDVVASLARDGLHLVFEVMSMLDQTHGSRYKRGGCVVTSVCDFKSSDDFVHILPLVQKHEICLRLGLPTDGYYVASGTDAVAAATRAITKMRDYMTNSIFDLSVAPHLEHFPGNTTHSELIGDVLEGVVARCSRGRGASEEFIKIKFPRYTTVTMLLRPSIGAWRASREVDIDDEVARFVARWCNSQGGIELYTMLCTSAMHRAREHILSSAFGPRDDEDGPSDNAKIGLHILIADEIFDNVHHNLIDNDVSNNFNNNVNNNVNNNNDENKSKNKRLILVAGPIGYGKSSLSERIVSVLGPSVAAHCDCDLLGMGRMDDVLKLGRERNPATLSHVAMLLAKYDTVIVSAGMGQFLEQSSGKFTLVNNLAKILQSDLSLQLYLVVPDDIDAAYGDDKRVSETIAWRLREGIWASPLKVPVERIVQQSRKNRDILVNSVMPAVDAKNIMNYSDCENRVESIVKVEVQSIVLDSLAVKQVRLLVEVYGLGVHHVTLEFHKTRSMVPIAKLDEYRSATIGREFVGRYYKLSSGSSTHESIVFEPGTFGPNVSRPHVTVRSGRHAPKDTALVAAAVNDGRADVTMDGITYKIPEMVSVPEVRVRPLDIIVLPV